MFCCTLLYVHSSIAIILMGKRELVALLNLSSWCLVMVEQFFLAVLRGCLRFVIVVFPDHTHLLFFKKPIGHISNLSIEKNIFPKDLKNARVVPLFKKSKRSEVGDYRPVSVLSVVSKILERAVYTQLQRKNFFLTFSLVLEATSQLTHV